MKYKKIEEHKWMNLKTYQTFRTDYYRNVDGKKANFIDTAENFVDGKFGLDYCKNFYMRCEQNIPKFFGNTEFICTSHDNTITGKKVLIVGGGPSSVDIEWQDNYDYIFSTNNYYKKFKDKKPYLITFTPYMNLLDPKIHEFLNSNDCLIGLEPEFLKPEEVKMLREFFPLFKDRIISYQTRYSSAIGVSTRQAALAVLLGASEVHMCGMDLFQDEDSLKHSFEKQKDLPRWRKNYGLEFQNRQVIAFWDYIKTIAKNNNCKLVNLAEDLSYNCMSFITKENK